MTWPNQNTANESSAGALLLSNAIAASVTTASSLSQFALLQELVSNMLIDSPPAVVIKTTGAATVGAFTCSSAVSSGLINSSSPTAGIGYATGAGGIVTQASNKTTAVELSKVCGQIVTNNAEVLPGAEAKFVVTNSTVAATDVVLAALAAGGTSGSYGLFVSAVAAGSYDLTLTNLSAVSLTQAVTINIAVLKGVSA